MELASKRLNEEERRVKEESLKRVVKTPVLNLSNCGL